MLITAYVHQPDKSSTEQLITGLPERIGTDERVVDIVAHLLDHLRPGASVRVSVPDEQGGSDFTIDYVEQR